VSCGNDSNALRLGVGEMEYRYCMKPAQVLLLRAIGWEGVEASSSTGSKGERSPEKAKALYCLLNKKRIRREKEG